MNPDEYRVMFEVEDHHWWYVGLRGVFNDFWRAHVGQQDVRVLDVGCGTGATLTALAAISRPTGVDVAVEAIRFCRQRRHMQTAVATAEALPFPAASFDVALSFDVLCHRSITEKRVPLQEIHRVLKPGGVLFLNLPAYQWLYSSHDAAVHTDHRFTRREATALLRQCAFKPLQATYWNMLLFPLIVPVRLWRKLLRRAGSDLTDGSRRMMDRLLSRVLAFERWCSRVTPLPFGLSIFTAARKC